MQKKYTVLGMSCAACSSAVERAAHSLDCVLNAEVNLMAGTLTVTFTDGAVDDAPLYKAVRDAGYNLLAYSPASLKKKETSGVKGWRLIASFLLLLPIFYLAMGKMMGLPYPDITDRLSATLQLVLTVPVIIINFKYFTVGYKRLFSGHPNMDSLIALGCTASFCYSLYNTVRIFAAGGHHTLYYESTAMILTFITIGKYLEAKSKKKTSAAIEGLLRLAPEEAILLKDSAEYPILAADLKVGDRILLKPGMSVPADGIVTSGSSFVNEASMTGESLPRAVEPGDRVRTGTVNLTGRIEFTAEKVAGDTTLSKMITLVEQAAAGKAPVGRLADKIAGVFVPVIITIALLAAAAWLFVSKDFETALRIGVSVLVIACPCSLGLATPAAIMAGTGKGAEKGVLFRSAAALEECGKVDTVVFDKTGTLTEGKPILTGVYAIDGNEDALLAAVASLEQSSVHPIAEAILSVAKERKLSLSATVDFLEQPGKGISGTVNGNVCRALSLSRAEKEFPNEPLPVGILNAIKGQTAVLYFENGKLLGALALSDKAKEDSKKAIRDLQKKGVRCLMLSGDRKDAAEYIGKELGMDGVISEVLPEDKEKTVSSLKAEGKKVAMVGDGINDAPALATADIGIAMGGGTDIAIETADVVLMNDHPTGVFTAIALSKQTMRIIKQNLFFAFFYNLIGVTLAVVCIANPMIASAAMSLSSICVLSNALRLRRFMKTEEPPQTAIPQNCPTDNCPVIKEKINIKETNTVKTTLVIEGMMCMHCVSHVKKALESLPETTAEVSLEEKTATVTHPETVSIEVLKKAVTDAGYQVK